MHWIPFVILAYVVVLVQVTVWGTLTFTGTAIGSIGPDLAAMVAVFIALNARRGTEVMIAAWILGFGLDLTTGGGTVSAAAVGPMAAGYALAAGAIHRVREAFFRERAVTQAFLAALFCLVAHGLWVTVQCLLAYEVVTWSTWGRLLLQAAALACYTGVLMPLVNLLLRRVRGLLISAPLRRGRRR